MACIAPVLFLARKIAVCLLLIPFYELYDKSKRIFMFVERNLNPEGKRVGDCVIRAIAYALQYTWERAYIELAIEGFTEYDMPSSNRVWDKYLRNHGFRRYIAPDTCPDCYTVKDFCREHPWGVFILATGTHVLVCHNGDYVDSWDSGDEPIIYYYEKGEP